MMTSMQSLLLFLLMLGTVSAGYLRGEFWGLLNETDPSEQNRIVGGDVPGDRDYRFFVSLRFRDHHWCGGTLLPGGEWVLTVAHCVARNDLTVNNVIVSAYMSKPSQKDYETHIHASVTETLIYPDYDKPTKMYDAALIKISPPVTNVATLKLNLEDSAPSTGTSLTAIGMGDVDPDRNIYQGAEQLMTTTISTVDHEKCQSYYGQTYDGGQTYHGMKIDETSMLCANTYGQDTCAGDSGGPLFKDGVIYGLTSFGKGGCGNNIPGVYVRVSAISKWVCDIVSGACAESERQEVPAASTCTDADSSLCFWLSKKHTSKRSYYCDRFSSVRNACPVTCEACV